MFNKREADLITIGQYISYQVCGLKKTTNEWYLQVGRDYVDYALSINDKGVHYEKKRLLGGFGSDARIRMMNFILQYNDIPECVTKNVELRSGDTVCKVRLFKNVKDVDRKSEPFYVQDFFGYCNTFVVLDGFMSYGYWEGRYMLKSLLDKFNVPVLIQAGFLFYGDYEVEARDNVDSGILDKLEKYYKEIGFKNVNSIIGNYEDSIIMLYDPTGKALRDKSQSSGVTESESYDLGNSTIFKDKCESNTEFRFK